MTSWIRSAKILTCINMSNSISPRGMVKGCIMPSILGDWAQIMSMQQHQKLRWLYRCLCMIERRRHGIGKSMLQNMSSTIFMEYCHQGLDLGLKVWYLLNGIRCDKLSTAVAAVRVHPDRYKKNFDKVVSFLTQYIDKKALTPSVKVASVAQTRPVKWQKTSATCDTFKE